LHPQQSIDQIWHLMTFC